MNPALSVIFFTTLSGAGYGLLAWVGIVLLAGPAPSGVAGAGATLAFAAALGLVLASVGLLSSTFHLGKPLRAWRAFSQWRTSWLSREGVMAMLTCLPALAVPVLAPGPGFAAGAVPWLGLVLVVSAALTVACTAMIYASLKPIPAWRHPLVVPVYLLFAAQSGLALALAIRAAGDGRAAALAIAGSGLLLVAAKWRYWRDIDHASLPADPASAVGLPGRSVGVFERPHTEGNYITREMGFVLARRHAARLRIIAGALFAGAPLLLALVALAWPAGLAMAAPPAAIAVLAGAFVERWLFFAQARHAVMAYY